MLNNCNSANYNSEASWNNINGHLSTVGLNGISSYYGTYDQNGNINEIIDTLVDGYPKYRGGSYVSTSGQLSKASYVVHSFDGKRDDVGFRIAKASGVIDSTNYVLVQDVNNQGDATNNNYGAVNYAYQIKKYPVTNSEYASFLNAVASSSSSPGVLVYNLWVEDMSTSSRGGIDRTGSFTTGYSYSVRNNMGDKPVNYIDWFCAARYVNWLHNGASSGAGTETGVYELSDMVFGTAKPSVSNSRSTFWIPNENEWYKAAYYKGGGLSSGYWTYATQSDTAPQTVETLDNGEAYRTTVESNCYSPTPTKTPTKTPTTTPTPTKSVTPSVTQTKTPTKSITATKTPTNTLTATRTNTPTITVTKTPTKTRTTTPTTTPPNSATPTITRSITPTATVTKTPTKSSTVTPTPSKSLATSVEIGQLIYQNNVYVGNDIAVVYKGFVLEGKLVPDVATLYEQPDVTPTRTPTVTPTITPTISVTPTNTPTNSVTPTITITPTNSLTRTPTRTPTTPPSITSLYVCNFDPIVYNGQYTWDNNNDGIPTYTKNLTGPTDQIIIEYSSLYEAWLMYTTASYALNQPYFTCPTLIGNWDITEYTPGETSSIGYSLSTACPVLPPDIPFVGSSPTPTVSITPSRTPTITVTKTITRTPTKSRTPTKTPTKSLTPTRTKTPTITVTKSSTPQPTTTPSITLTATPAVTTTPTQSVTATPGPTVTPTPTISVTKSVTPSITPTITPTITLTSTPTTTPTTTVTRTPTISVTKSITPTITLTPTITKTVSLTPSNTLTSTPTQTPTQTITITPTNSLTPIPTSSPTVSITPTISITPSPTVTPTITPTITPTKSVTPGLTVTPTASITQSVSITPTVSVTPSITPTTSITPSISVTQTPTITVTPSITVTLTPTTTPTPSYTPTITPTPQGSTNSLVAVAWNSNQSAISTDSGQTWQTNNLTASRYWGGVAYGLGKFIAYAYLYGGNIINVSSDGVSWVESILSPTGDTNSQFASANYEWASIFFGNGRFIITSNSSAIAAVSSNGYNWTEVTLPAMGTWKGGAYGNNTYVLLARGSSIAATSTDGITWTQRSVGISRNWNSLSFVNDKFIAVAENSPLILYSSDGTSWNNSSVLPTSSLWKKAVYGNNRVVVFGNVSRVAVSTNNAQSFTEYPIVGEYWNDLIYKNNFVLIGQGTVVLTSPDGISWTQRTIASSSWSAIA